MTTGLILGAVEDHSLAATFTASQASASLADDNLATPYLSELWQSPSVQHNETLIQVDLGAAYSIASVGLAGTNAEEFDRMRVRLSTSALAQRERKFPDTTVTVTGATGTHADVDDDPESPDANSITSTTDAGSVAHLKMNTPSSSPVQGADLQIFRVLVTAPAGGAASLDAVKLYANGVFKKTLLAPGGSEPQSYFTVTAGTSKMFHAYFDMADGGAASGADVEIYIEWSGGAATTGGVKIAAADWLALVSSDTEGAWVRFWPSDLSGILASHHPDTSTLRPAAAWTYSTGGSYAHVSARYIEIELDWRFNSDGYAQAGRAPIGPSVFQPHRLGYSWGSRWLDQRARRVIRLTNDNLDEDVMSQVVQFLGFGNQMAGLLVIPQPDRTAKNLHHLPFFATVGDEIFGSHLAHSIDRYNLPIELVEDA